MASTRNIISYKEGNERMYIFDHSLNRNTQEISYDPEKHLSMHHGVEIFVLLKGNIEFLIENRTYSLAKRDILLINETEIHTIRATEDSEYERVTLHILPSFFDKYEITDYKKVFSDRAPGRYNLVQGHSPDGTKIGELIMKIDTYIQENPICDKVIDAVVIELLYLLNKASLSKGEKGNKTVSEIFRYINENLTEPLTLDALAEKFYISKSHMCRIFKKEVGFSIRDYITQKRIICVQQYCQEGMSITEAAFRAGFENYSNFYRIYVDRVGSSPREFLKIK